MVGKAKTYKALGLVGSDIEISTLPDLKDRYGPNGEDGD